MRNSRLAFTLVELSIVLVILGLLVGGVLSGQSLIHAAELRSITDQHDQYLAATHTFRDKYFGLPGDITNATAFWGAADGSTGNTSACFNTVGTGTATCNGNGDGQLTFLTSDNAASNESMRFWQQLANAGLITGTYTGVGTTNGGFSSTTLNSPKGKVSSSLWFVGYIPTQTGTDNNSGRFDGNFGNVFEFGAVQANYAPEAPLLKPEDAWNIDTKIDDGKPATGSVESLELDQLGNCTDSQDPSNSTANYNLSNAAIACSLLFVQVF